MSRFTSTSRLDRDVHPQFFEASLTILLATSLATYTLVYGQRGRVRRLFIGLLASIIVWSGGVALSRAFADPVAANIATRISFLGIFALPPVWFALALHLTRRSDYVLARSALALLALPSLLAFTALATNSWHHLYMREPSLLITHGPQEWAGPAFWCWAAWSYLLVFGASVRYVRWSWRLVSNDSRMRGGLVCVASVLPLSGNFAHLLGWTAPGHDVTPVLLGAATAMLFVADWRFRLLDTLPVARRDVIEQLRDGVVVADAQGTILDMNPAAERMVDAPLADLVGKPIVHAVAAQAIDRFDLDEAAFNRSVVEMCNSANGFETYIENYAGRHFEIRGAGVTDLAGQVSGLYIILRDVTERSRFEEAERESRRARTIASLAAGITHEVNNPLAYVRANISYVIDAIPELPDEKSETHELRAVLAEALEGVDRIGTIVERVRRFTDSRSGTTESISIARVIEEATRVRSRVPGPAVEVLTDVAADLPPAIGLPDSLVEALLNLIDNAKYAVQERGGVIRVKALQREKAIRIEVEDDGPGVPEELREQIFEPFFTASLNEFGTGLGLAISGKLVAEFGGTLSYEPVPKGGARFVIELPTV